MLEISYLHDKQINNIWTLDQLIITIQLNYNILNFYIIS